MGIKVKYFYDLHIHSCLSPCGDDDMTPANIAGMAALKGLNIVALCDHNSVKNCPAFFVHCKRTGLIPIAGMELTTAEEIHLICLFKTLDNALSFGDEVEKKRIRVKNRKDIFGNQFITDSEDKVAGEEEFFLPNATELSLEEAVELCRGKGGICYPAHVDRQANGIVSILGTFPASPVFACAEFADSANVEAYRRDYPELEGKKLVISSDAHYLWDINEAENFFMLDDEPYSSALVTQRLFELLGS